MRQFNMSIDDEEKLGDILIRYNIAFIHRHIIPGGFANV